MEEANFARISGQMAKQEARDGSNKTVASTGSNIY
jgi:hypothetical protein